MLRGGNRCFLHASIGREKFGVHLNDYVHINLTVKRVRFEERNRVLGVSNRSALAMQAWHSNADSNTSYHHPRTWSFILTLAIHALEGTTAKLLPWLCLELSSSTFSLRLRRLSLHVAWYVDCMLPSLWWSIRTDERIKYPVLCVTYNLYFHPLANYPGPKLWAATRFRYVLSVWTGRLHTDVQALHCRYGNIVRIASDEISFACADAWNDIYSNAPGRPAFPKSKLWHGAAPGRPHSVLNALDPKVHSRFRKTMDSAFTEKALRLQEPVVQKHVALFIAQLDKLASKKPEGAVVDVVQWFAFVAFDLVGDLGFGEPFGCLESGELHPWISLIFASLRAATYGAVLGFYPALSWLMSLTIPKSVLEKYARHWEFSVDKVNRRLEKEQERSDFIGKIKLDDAGVNGITLPELHATAGLLIVAGSETTTTVLSGIVNYLVKTPEKLAALTDEVRTAFENESDMTLSALKDLPYLGAVVQEGLRMCNPT
jgi:cytochrome P450